MDKYIGRILGLIDELGLADDTIVIFTSDNGTTHLKQEVDYNFFNSVGKLRGLKGSLYEGGVRVPLIVRWPGKIKADSSSDFVTGFEDWIPTLLELAGHKGEEDEGLDGISIAPTLRGKKQPGREFLYREFSGYGGQQALWLGKWKGIRQRLLRDKKKPVKEKLRIQLYDLEKDPSESEDVASKNPEVVARIRKLLEQEHTPSKFFPIKPID